MQHHLSSQYEEELARIRDRLMQMGTRVGAMVRKAVQALEEGNPGLAREVIDTDPTVNRDEVEIDEACLETIARRQPAASDLRFITLALKVVTDLERIGDLAVNLSERVVEYGGWNDRSAVERIRGLADGALAMLDRALTAFLDHDAEQAQRVLAEDDHVDRAYEEFFEGVIESARREAETRRAIGLLFAGKYLERIADHATNIAEMVVFMVRGKDIRHLSSRPPAPPES